MRPTPAEALQELTLTTARVVRALVDPNHPPHADDHLLFKEMDEAIKRVESALKSVPVPGGRPDGGMLYPDPPPQRDGSRGGW